MTTLPNVIHRAPAFFYAAAAMMFVASVAITWSEVGSNFTYAEPGNPMYRQALLRGVYGAAYEAICLMANGVLVQVLLAIWARLPRSADAAGGAR